MKRKKHPRSAEFLRWFARNRTRAAPVAGTFYRVIGPSHTTAEHIVSGAGAKKAGGRWNPLGEMRVVYLSHDPETALSEALEHFRYYNLPDAEGLPKVVVSVDVALDDVLDLRAGFLDADSRKLIAEFLAEDWRALNARSEESASQAFGRASFANGLQGIIVPSKPARNGANLLVFPDTLSRNHCLEVQNAHELDRLGKSR